MNFTNIVSHNLRSHSSNLLMLLETMLVENPEIKDQEFYNMFKEAATGLSTTISNLHDISNIQTNTDLKKEQIDVNTFVEGALSNIKSLANEADVKIMNQTIGYIKISAVPVYLDSILINLLTNAIKYRSLDRDSTVTIKSDVDSDGITISVIDNGIGIDMDQIGEKVFKLHMTTSSDSNSKGIGLFLTKSHVEAMNGWIDFTSQVNKGSTFKFFLPHE